MAFLLEEGRRQFAEFPRDIEEEGIKFNVENATEDLISGLFCSYEPPTSKKLQYKAAKAVREDPKKFSYRPHVPKSILKWKIKKLNKKKTKTSNNALGASETRDDTNNSMVVYDKKSVTWRDERLKGNRTEMENTVVGIASKYCGGACNQGEDIADYLSSPTGRATQNFFMGGPETPGSMASMASSVFGGKSEKSEEISKRVLYDDLGNPIREDDVNEDDNASYFPSTPASTTAGANPTTPSNAKNPEYDGHSNLFCSNIPFIDTVIEGIGIAGIVAASAAVAAGVPENLCNPYTTRTKPKTSNVDDDNQHVTVVSNKKRDQISEELRQAEESLGIYEPESYDQPSEKSGDFKLKRQSTPRHARPDSKFDDEGEDKDDESQKEDDESQIQSETKPSEEQMSGERSYANSDITMGNTTIKHFSVKASLFDDAIDEPSKKRESFTSMVEELKAVQMEKRLEGSSQHNVDSIKNGYEKIRKSPKHAVVTNSYKKSLMRSPSTPLSRGKNSGIFEQRSGSVANLAKQFESPRASRGNLRKIRTSVDPTECRTNNPSGFSNGVLLPPTPRRKSPETPTGYSMVNKKFESQDWDKNCRNNSTEEATARTTVSVNTDAEIREEASTILDVGPREKKRPSFVGRRPISLVTGPETVENDDEETNNNTTDPPEEREETETTNNEEKKKANKKKTRNEKKKVSRMKSFKKSMEKAMAPGLNAIRKVESQRILNKIS